MDIRSWLGRTKNHFSFLVLNCMCNWISMFKHSLPPPIQYFAGLTDRKSHHALHILKFHESQIMLDSETVASNCQNWQVNKRVHRHLGTTRDQQVNKRIQTLCSTRMCGSASEQKDSHTHTGTTRNQQANKRIQTPWSTRMHESASEQKDSPTLWSKRMHDSTSEQNTWINTGIHHKLWMQYINTNAWIKNQTQYMNQ